MDFGVKRIFHLTRRSAKSNPGAAAGDPLHYEALRLQPIRDGLAVGRSQSEAIGKLFRRQPAMIERRSWILLIAQELA